MSERHSDKAAETFTVSETYALEDEHFGYQGPLPDDSEEEPVNDVGHPLDCTCPVCLPEAYDPTELAAGRPSRRFGVAS